MGIGKKKKQDKIKDSTTQFVKQTLSCIIFVSSTSTCDIFSSVIMLFLFGNLSIMELKAFSRSRVGAIIRVDCDKIPNLSI